MIRKKHITLCFSLFLALSMVLGPLIPVTATDDVSDEITETEVVTEPAADVPDPEPDPEPEAEEEPDVTPTGDEGTVTVPTVPAQDGQGEDDEKDFAVADVPSNELAEVGESNVSTFANNDVNLEVGENKTLPGSGGDWTSNHSWSSDNSAVATVSGNGNSAIVTGVSEGTATITHTYYYGILKQTETFNVTVKKPEPLGTATVYVYIAAMDESDNRYSKEMTDLLGVDYDSINGSNWFAAGTVELDLSSLSDGGKLDTILNTKEDWENILGQIRQNRIDTTKTINKTNRSNKINDYIDQVIQDTTKTNKGSKLLLAPGAGSAQTNNDNDGLYFQSGSRYSADGKNDSGGDYTWHLDLRFETVHINYLYGNNGINTGDCKDGTSAGSKVFIKGATMNYTPTIQAPVGYKIVGYYTDENCTDGKEWNAVNQPINADTNVYIKIVPLSNVTINYKIQEGNGTVTDPSKNNNPYQTGQDSFNPVKGNPVGSTADPDADWTFDGWYSDESCTQLFSDQAKLVPESPAEGWPEGAEYNYYAKFVPKTKKIYVQSNVSGNAADRNKQFTYHLKVMNGDSPVTDSIKLSDGKVINYDSENKAHVFTLSHGQSIETEELPQFYSFRVTQQETSESGAHKDGYSTTLTTNCNDPNGSLATNSHGHLLNHQDLTNKDRAEVFFTNEKNMTVPTGMEDQDTAIHGLLLSAGAGLLLIGAIVVLRRRMNAI